MSRPTMQQRRARIEAARTSGALLRTTLATRATATEDRTVTGLGVPYDEVIEHWFGREAFDPGSVDSEGARLLWQHDWTQPLGTVTGSDDETGHRITGRVSQIAAGDDALTLVRDDVIRGFSIGFEPIEYRVEVNEDTDEETIRWTKVRAREFSLVTFPAYESAAITPKSAAGGTTTERTAMPDTPAGTLTRDDLTPITDQLDDLARQVQRNTAAHTPAPETPWASMGEFVRALVNERDTTGAMDYYARAFAGGVVADGEPVADIDGSGFLGNFIRFVQERRRVINLFQTGSLPADGMDVSYSQLVSMSVQVAEQEHESDDLVGPGRVVFKNATEPIKTAGGWSELSRQAIERGNVPQLDVMYTGLGLQYAKWGETYVRTRLITELDKIITAGGDGVIALPDANPDAFDWFDAIVDAGDVYEDRGFTMSGLLVSPDVFKGLYRLSGADDRPLLTVYGQGVNVAGEIDLTQRDGNIGRVPVTVLRKTTGRAFFYDPVAMKTLENPGSPFRLQDDNIINLTRAFSLYGYMSIIAPFPTALVPVTMGAATAEPAA